MCICIYFLRMFWRHSSKVKFNIHFNPWKWYIVSEVPSFYFLAFAVCGLGTVSSWNKKENRVNSRSGLLLKLWILFYFFLFNLNHKYVSSPIEIDLKKKIKIWGSKLYFLWINGAIFIPWACCFYLPAPAQLLMPLCSTLYVVNFCLWFFLQK